MELTRRVRVNAAAGSADKSFRLDYKRLSLKLSRAPSSDKEYSGPIWVFRAEPLIIMTIPACWESVRECECISPLHTGVLTGLHVCIPACVHVSGLGRTCLCLEKKAAHMNVALWMCVLYFCMWASAWDRVSQVCLCRSEIKLLVGAGDPLTVATAERYKIKANSFRGLQVTDGLRERERGVCGLYCNFFTDKKSRKKARMDWWGDG